MIKVSNLYECNKEHKVIGLKFCCTKYNSSIARGQYLDLSVLYIIDGEIQYAKKEYADKHDIRDENNICNWETVKKVLKVFFDDSPEQVDVIIKNLTEDSIGYSIIENIIDKKINKLEKKQKKLELLKKS